MAKKLLSALLSVMLVASSAVMASAADTSKVETGLDTDYSNASQQLDDTYGYDGNDLGATYSPEGTTFKVWAPTAQDMKLNLYTTGSDSEEGAEKISTTKMNYDDKSGIWSLKVDGDLKNKYYTYSVIAKNVTGKKVTNKETQDIYSYATGVNGKRTQIVDLKDTDPEGWDKDTHVVLDRVTDSYVWEVHVKDFSYAKNSGVSEANRGKYLAFTEEGTTLNNEGKISTCIDYLKKQGVTTVQINPFYDFGSVDEGGSDTQFNWGYDPVNYNVPEGSYSSNPYDGNVRIKECKQMIQALHKAGISVVMDVVYNHTYSADSCFEAVVPNYYYRMNANGTYSNGSGCGNETASERRMFRNFMVQSCLYWVNEYHVDGFRFDLMALHDCEAMNVIREKLDEIDPRLSMWGEGWTGGSTNTPAKTYTGANFRGAKQQAAGSLNERIAFFSDEYRDGLKGSVFEMKGMGWLQGGGSYKTINLGVQANPSNYHAKSQTQVVTYTSCHDNQTLWDRLAFSQDLDDYFRARNSVLVAENKLAGGMLNMSQGIMFTLAGEEMGRSKDNDHNSYKSSATLNMIDWELVKTNADIVSYYAGMKEIRNAFSPFGATKNEGFTYKSEPIDPTYSDSGVLTGSKGYIGQWTNTAEGEWKNLVVLANNKENDLEVTIDNPNTKWVVIADAAQAGTKKIRTNDSNTFALPARSMIVAVDEDSFNSAAVKSDRGVVSVKAVNNITNTVIDEYSITGKIGDAYEVKIPDTLGSEFDMVSFEGELEGTFSEEAKDVKLYFSYYVPDSVKKDINGDGKSNIKDATFIQKALIKKVTMTAEQEKLADVNLSGNVSISDVTMLQKYFADMSVGSGTVTVNYYKDGTDEKIADSVEYKGKVGEQFAPVPVTALGYVINEEKIPASTVTVPYGNATVNYYYKKGSSIVNVYVKHSGSKTWDPNLYVWGNKNGVDSSGYTGNWPGKKLTKADGESWYKYTFSASSGDDSYNVIVNDGTMQSGDCKGFVQNNLWVVIDDGKDGVNLKFYDTDPDKTPTAKPFFEG